MHCINQQLVLGMGSQLNIASDEDLVMRPKRDKCLVVIDEFLTVLPKMVINYFSPDSRKAAFSAVHLQA